MLLFCFHLQVKSEGVKNEFCVLLFYDRFMYTRISHGRCWCWRSEGETGALEKIWKGCEGKVVLRECRRKTGGSAVSSVRGLCCHNRGSFTGSAEMLERNKEAERVDMGSLGERDGENKKKQVISSARNRCLLYHTVASDNV